MGRKIQYHKNFKMRSTGLQISCNCNKNSQQGFLWILTSWFINKYMYYLCIYTHTRYIIIYISFKRPGYIFSAHACLHVCACVCVRVCERMYSQAVATEMARAPWLSHQRAMRTPNTQTTVCLFVFIALCAHGSQDFLDKWLIQVRGKKCSRWAWNNS